MGQSHGPILCSFQLTAVSILTVRNFLLRETFVYSSSPVRLYFNYCMKLTFDDK